MEVNPEILRDKSDVKQVVVTADEDEEITLLLELYILVGESSVGQADICFETTAL